MKRDLFTTTLVGILAVTLVLGAWSIAVDRNEARALLGKSVTVDVKAIADRIVDHQVVGTGPTARVSFAYLGDPVPAQFTDKEIPLMRTQSSYTTLNGVVRGGTDPLINVTTRVYSQPAFIKDGDEWRQVEYGETTKKQFDQTMRPDLLSYIFGTIAHAATIYSGVGDGYVDNEVDADWSGSRNAVDGFLFDYTGTLINAGSAAVPTKTTTYKISRAFLPFDTSSIPSNATISAATLNVYVTEQGFPDNDGNDFVTTVQTSQGTHTQLTTTDYDQCGAVNSPTEGNDSGQRKDLTSVSTNAYLSITLNSTGLGWIKKSGASSNCTATAGISCFGIREGHDVVNDTISADRDSRMGFSSSETSGTTQDPYLDVTYTVPASALPAGSLKIGANGSIKIIGGGVKVL